MERDTVVGIVTKIDLIEYLAKKTTESIPPPPAKKKKKSNDARAQ
jgi:hypothetical protein